MLVLRSYHPSCEDGSHSKKALSCKQHISKLVTATVGEFEVSCCFDFFITVLVVLLVAAVVVVDVVVVVEEVLNSRQELSLTIIP